MSIDVTYYDLGSGQIVANGNVPDADHAVLQKQEGQGVLLGRYDVAQFHVVNGRPIEYTPEEAARYAARPSILHTWNIGRRRWDDGRNEEQRAIAKNREVLTKIRRLEDGQHRAMREALLSGSNARLHALDKQIAALRGKLTKKEEA